MNTNEQLIHTFYSAFQNKDYKTMQSCYADNAVFSDPVFPKLNADEARAMWEMFCKQGKDLVIEFDNVTADQTSGSADWTASYTFSATGRKVVNRISASFKFENGKITRHIDRFGFYRWSRQSLGFIGLILGWSPLVKRKVRITALTSLKKYMRN